jgi:hypothetical protein
MPETQESKMAECRESETKRNAPLGSPRASVNTSVRLGRTIIAAVLGIHVDRGWNAGDLAARS